MIYLKDNQENKITFQKETDTPLVTSSLESGKVFSILMYQTMANDTGSTLITKGTFTNPNNPRWITLGFKITGSNSYPNGLVDLQPGTTYDLEVYYGDEPKQEVWGTTTYKWNTANFPWNSSINAETIKNTGVLKYSDIAFISGSVEPILKQYISDSEVINLLTGSASQEIVYVSPNEDAVLKIYQG